MTDVTDTVADVADVTIEDLQEALDAAERDMAHLQAEQQGIAVRISEAAHLENGAAEALVAATERHDQLPVLLFAAECQVIRAKIAVKTAKKDAFAALVPPLKAEGEAARERMKAAKAVSIAAGRKLTHAESSARSLWPQIAQLKRDLAALIAAHGKPPGRPIRSLW